MQYDHVLVSTNIINKKYVDAERDEARRGDPTPQVTSLSVGFREKKILIASKPFSSSANNKEVE